LAALKQKHKNIANFALAELILTDNDIGPVQHEIEVMMGKSLGAQRDAFVFASDYSKTAPLRTTKVHVVGRDTAGKSTLIRALLGGKFSEDYTPSYGINTTPVLARIDGTPWEEHGIKPLNGYCPDFLARFANIYLDKQKRSEHEKEREEAKERRNSIQKGVSKLVGTVARNSSTKLDGGRTPSRNSARRGSILRDVVDIFSRKKNPRLDDLEYEFYELDSDESSVYEEDEVYEKFHPEVLGKARRERDNIGFIISEFSGNRMYYSLYHAFLAESGIYLVTFNLSHLLCETEEEQKDTLRYLNYWIKAIRYNSPGASVMFVGTRFDHFKKTKAVKDFVDATNQCIAEITERIFPEMKHEKSKEDKALDAAKSFQAALSGANSRKVNLITNKEKKLLFFPVELKTGEGVKQVRQALDEAAPDQMFFKTQIPGRFLKFLDTMKSHGKPWIDAETVKQCAAKDLNGEEETEQALKYFHAIGYIMHITNIKSFKGCVVLDSTWLYENTTKILSVTGSDYINMGKIKAAGLNNDLSDVISNGLASRELLALLWDKDNFTFLLKYMEQNLIISRWGFDDEERVKYVIPSILQLKPSSLKPVCKDNLQCMFNFHHALTLGVYERIACQVVQSTLSSAKDSKAPELYYGFSKHYLGDDFTFYLERTPDVINCYIEDYKKPPIKCITRLLKMFGKVRECLGEGMKFETRLLIEPKVYESYESVKAKKLGNWC